MEVHTRYKANAFLDKMNEEVFMPRGLYAMVIVWSPDENTNAPSTPDVDIRSVHMDNAKIISESGLSLPHSVGERPNPSMKKKRRHIRGSDGSAHEAMMPLEVAPLIYPSLDATGERSISPSQKESIQERFRRNKKFVSGYYDRRAAAEYAGENPSAALSATSSVTSFRSKHADPNHPVNNGSTLSLLSGGRLGQHEPGREGYRATGPDGKLAPPHRSEDKAKRGSIGSMVGGVKKALQSNVMYLTIVNMPSNSEMAQAKFELEKRKNGFADRLKDLARGRSTEQ